ncbi:MAG TPA: glycosyltransferase family 2 protein [Candidatus Binatia bacterium]|jgi:cellulose synthase/poly-beta-1,6-N-acetylglucosamine synthase-like glycosyltransferase|nr:glycosyltransferase family 2 protein [Candidatus Binatia bacterium]
MRVFFLCLLPLWVVLLVESGLKLFFLGVRLWRRPERESRAEALTVSPRFLSFALLIPAHNEEEVIGETVRQLRALHYPSAHFTVIVIADGCTDHTVRSARDNGAVCVPWAEQTGRKGRALSRFLALERERLNAFDVVVVCDADTRLHTDALLFLNQAFLGGIQVGQGKLESEPQSSSLGALVALSEALSQDVDDCARKSLGWPVPLRGTGMAFRREILQEFGILPHTRAEDLELSLLLCLYRVPVTFVPEAIVYDAKPTSVSAAVRQRARWFQGHREVVGEYWQEVLSVFRKGNWGERALLFSLLLRPRGLFIGIRATVLLGCFFLVPRSPREMWLLVSTGTSAALCADLTYYLAGSALVTDRGSRRALWRCAFYLPMWLGAIVLSAFSTKRWLRVRDRGIQR